MLGGGSFFSFTGNSIGGGVASFWGGTGLVGWEVSVLFPVLERVG